MKPLFLTSPRGASWHCALFRCCTFAVLAFATSVFAQGARNGTVTGTVSNQATGDLLPGALITVEGTGITATAERGGTYSVTLPEGSHTLVIGFSGLDSARVGVTVSAGQTVAKDVQLSSGIYKM